MPLPQLKVKVKNGKECFAPLLFETELYEFSGGNQVDGLPPALSWGRGNMAPEAFDVLGCK